MLRTSNIDLDKRELKTVDNVGEHTCIFLAPWDPS